MFVSIKRLFCQFSLRLSVVLVTVTGFISSAYAVEVKLIPSLVTVEGRYPIDAKLQYTLKNSAILMPKTETTGPIIHLTAKTSHFDAGNAPRFIFIVEGDEALAEFMAKTYFIAAPNGEFYPANAPDFKRVDDKLLSYPAPVIDRSYRKAELEQWRWYPFLMKAMQLALEARKQGNHPFGAVLVQNGKIIASANNTVNTGKDFTAHAERNLETLVSKIPKDSRIGAVMVTSTEPCAMCAAGAVWTGIDTIVYGLSQEKLAVIAGYDEFVFPARNIVKRVKRRMTIIGPIFEPISAMIQQNFWKS